MENFAIDLDKVLDEFEKSEDSNVIVSQKTVDVNQFNPVNHFFLPRHSIDASSNPYTQEQDISSRRPSYASNSRDYLNYNTSYDINEKLDLSAADFSASTTSFNLSSDNSNSETLPDSNQSLKLIDSQSSRKIDHSDKSTPDTNILLSLSTTPRLATVYKQPLFSNGLDHMVDDVLSVQMTPKSELSKEANLEIKLLPSGLELGSNDDLSYTKYVVHNPSPFVNPEVKLSSNELVSEISKNDSLSTNDPSSCKVSDNTRKDSIENERNIYSVESVNEDNIIESSIYSVDKDEVDDDLNSEADEQRNVDKPWENVVLEKDFAGGFLSEVSNQPIDIVESKVVGFGVECVAELSPTDLEGYLRDLEKLSFPNLVDGEGAEGGMEPMISYLDAEIPQSYSPPIIEELPIDISNTLERNQETKILPIANVAAMSLNVGGARPKIKDNLNNSKKTSPFEVTKSFKLDTNNTLETAEVKEKVYPKSPSLANLTENCNSSTLQVNEDNNINKSKSDEDSLTDVSISPDEDQFSLEEEKNDSETVDADNINNESGTLGLVKLLRPTSLNLPAPLLINQNQIIVPEILQEVLTDTITNSPTLSETDSALPPSPEAGGLLENAEQSLQEEIKDIPKLETGDLIPEELSTDNVTQLESTNENINDHLEEATLADECMPEISEEEQLLGKIRPFWIPDDEAPNCLHCDSKFTVIKRRHHCRGCGKVLCSQCCNFRARIAYLDDKEARVCAPCLETLKKVLAVERLFNEGPLQTTSETNESQLDSADGTPGSGTPSPSQSPTHSQLQRLGGGRGSTSWPPNPNNPQEYCSLVSPLQQAQTYSARPPPVVMVPVGVLKRGDKPKREPKQVMFSDGIRPGGDLTELDLALSPEPKLPGRRSGPGGRSLRKIMDKSSPDYSINDKPDAEMLFQCLQDETARPVLFALTKNLFVSIKLVKLDCCLHKECWVFASKGLNCVGQDEVMVLLERLPDEKTLPRDIFLLFTALYDNASMGNPVNELGHLLFPEGLLGSRDHGAFLFLRPTYQCLSKLHLPQAPYLVALLLQKWEVPWAKVFPLRLLLRIGAEYRYYPCPLVSVRLRKPVFGEIGHTIMSVLADFRNYQYTLPTIPGVMVCMEDKRTTVCFPKNRYSQVMKVVGSSNEHVLGLGASFSLDADSHLVCVQDEEGNYQTQAINIQNTERKVTGASFIVFSGALKSTTGLTAKSSIVEDGLLVQITAETMIALKSSFQQMKDFIINCGQVDAVSPEEQVVLKWVEDDRNFNIGVRSPIDGQCLDGVESLRINSGTDYYADKHLIRWTEVFFLATDALGRRKGEPADPSKLADAVAQACCLALVSHLSQLTEAELTNIGLRVTLDSEKVGYEIGSKEEPLPSLYMVDLDTSLIPVITNATSSNSADGGSLTLELLFHILRK